MRKLQAFIVGLLVVLFLGYSASANAATWTVTKRANSNDGACDADCSLREAVAAADSLDTIVFSGGYNVDDLFTLGGEEIVVTKRITIDGTLNNSTTVQLSGSLTSRIFLIETGGGLDLRNMRIVQGNGASSNFANGIGGAIYAKNSASLSLDRVSVSDNRAQQDGAIRLNTGTHHITNSSFTINTAQLRNALTVENGTLFMANVTMTGNYGTDPNLSACALCNLQDGEVTMRNVTITNNSASDCAGVCNQGTLNIGNTIIAENIGASRPDIDNVSGTIVSVGGNLIGELNFTIPPGTFTQPNDATGINPLLAATHADEDLVGNPAFHPLQAGSPARNTGLNANAVDPLTNQPLTTDIRGAGFPRIIDTTVDKGAFEDASGDTSLIVSTTLDSNNDNVCDIVCSLREAVDQAGVHPGTDTITFTQFVKFGHSPLSEITIQNQTVNIVGHPPNGAGYPQNGGLAISGFLGNCRIFRLDNATVSMSGMSLIHGRGIGAGGTFGGAILAENNSNLTLDRVIVRDSSAVAYGALYLSGGTHRIINSTINNNSANTGLAIGVSGTMYMANTTVSGNLDSDGGTGIGAIYVTGTANIRNSTIAFNRTSGGTGGGIFSAGTLNIGNSIVANNIAAISPDIERSSGVITSVGGNLVLDTNGFPAGTFNQANDHTGVDPQLGVLADNGGNVPTHEIQAFSVAVNQGVNANAVDPFDNSPLSNDARGQGFPRLQSTTVDKGAFESAAPTAASATVSGIITNQEGTPVTGVVVRLDGTMVRKTITDASGKYEFDNVETNGFYTVTPSRVNYGFSPSQRSFSSIGAHTEATFSAIPDAIHNSNPLDTPEYFVRQHYLDFLGREPDEAGFNFWSDQISECGTDAACIERRRINVSAAYFLSIEFQETGGLVDGLYRVSYGRRPFYNEFMPDIAAIAHDVVVGKSGWEGQLAGNKQAFVTAFVQRPAFKGLYEGLSNTAYVDTLISHSGVTFTAGERDVLIAALTNGTMTRADILRQVAEDERFKTARFNQTFVMMEYFGYLRRDPDDSGYQFWLNKLNQFGGNFEQAEMVKAFILSGEYRNRFPN